MKRKKDISEILLFINPHKKFLLNWDKFTFDGLCCLLTAICSERVKTLVGLFGNKGQPQLIKLLRFSFFLK